MFTPLESERLYYREFVTEDAQLMYELDSDPDVHRYLLDGVSPNVEHSMKAIHYIRQQYEERGLGRMAAFVKGTDEFVGWVGLKIEENTINGYSGFYDIGYRIMQKEWHKGYATEATRFFIDYAFNMLVVQKINAYVFETNAASRKVLEKCGLKPIAIFDYEGIDSVWYEIENPAFKKV
jgi:ribosomal-protein-alanine N-acetyltransferase